MSIVKKIEKKLSQAAPAYGEEFMDALSDEFGVEFLRAANGWEVRKGGRILGVALCQIPPALNCWKTVWD